MSDWETYAAAYRARASQQGAALEQTRVALLERAKSAAEMLRNEFDVRAVYLFGSVVGARFGRSSDLDLAVTGLDPLDYLRAWRLVSETLAWEFDLIRTEEAKPTLLRHIVEEGVAL